MHPLIARGAALLPLPLLAFLNAEGVASLVAARLPPAPLVVPASTRARAPTAPTHATSADPILARNPFDSTAKRLRVDPPAPESVVDPALAPACDGVSVVAIAASDDPAWSLAALRHGADAHTYLRRRGGDLDAWRVAYVGWDRVWLTDGTTLCQSAMFAPHDPIPEPKRETAKPTVADKRIRATEPGRFAIDRGLFEQLVGDPTTLAKSTRFKLERGAMRIYGVGAGTLLGTLGLADGDALESINGFDLTHPESALEAYARLRQAPHLTLKVRRGDKEVQLDYDVD